MTKYRILILIALVALIAAFFLLDSGRYLSLEYFRDRQAAFMDYHAAHPLITGLGFLCLYVTVTGLSLPTAGILTIIGGAVFGLLWGTVLASFASTIGATLAFLASRFLFRDLILSRYGNRLAPVNAGIRTDGAWYLFTLRLIPVFPYFVINLVMGLTSIRTATFFAVSQAGMLPVTVIYVNAGTRIAAIRHPGDILSPELIASLVLLGVFPLAAKKTVDLIRARRRSATTRAGHEEI